MSDVVAAFSEMARANACAVHGPIPATDAAGLVAQILRDEAGAGPVALASDDEALRGLALADAVRATGRPLCCPDDADWDAGVRRATVGITGAFLGVAEQGVFALVCTPSAPRATSLLPATHVCIVYTDAILATFADAIERVASSPLPSALTWIGGPSRTGDLEMVQTLGVHGPKTVEVVLVRP